MSGAAVSARRLTKTYRLFESPWQRLWEAVSGRPRHRAQNALEDVSFELEPGEAFGIVGENGAGKSTLLKIIAGVLEPTSGEATVSGKVASILELGSGFHPEFSGRQNLMLNAAALGLGRREALAKLERIVEWSELGAAIDQPLKSYSTGMAMRLAFSIATQVEPDVLVVDEALSVGDGYFQKKSMDRMNELVRSGTTLLFCSHAMYYVSAFCERALWLKGGRRGATRRRSRRDRRLRALPAGKVRRAERGRHGHERRARGPDAGARSPGGGHRSHRAPRRSVPSRRSLGSAGGVGVRRSGARVPSRRRRQSQRRHRGLLLHHHRLTWLPGRPARAAIACCSRCRACRWSRATSTSTSISATRTGSTSTTAIDCRPASRCAARRTASDWCRSSIRSPSRRRPPAIAAPLPDAPQHQDMSRSRADAPSLAVVIVHYHAARALAGAVAAIERDLERSGIAAEWCVVDNGSTAEERSVLESLDLPVRAGHGQLGLRRWRQPGRRRDHRAERHRPQPRRRGSSRLLDRALLDELERGAGAAAPRLYWDHQRRFLLPPGEERSRDWELLSLLAKRFAGCAARARRRWRRDARRHWEATGSLASTRLSGAMLAISRAAWSRVGPFDESYRLYFEETDWLLRLEAAGLTAAPGGGGRGGAWLRAQHQVRAAGRALVRPVGAALSRAPLRARLRAAARLRWLAASTRREASRRRRRGARAHCRARSRSRRRARCGSSCRPIAKGFRRRASACAEPTLGDWRPPVDADARERPRRHEPVRRERERARARTLVDRSRCARSQPSTRPLRTGRCRPSSGSSPTRAPAAGTRGTARRPCRGPAAGAPRRSRAPPAARTTTAGWRENQPSIRRSAAPASAPMLARFAQESRDRFRMLGIEQRVAEQQTVAVRSHHAPADQVSTAIDPVEPVLDVGAAQVAPFEVGLPALDQQAVARRHPLEEIVELGAEAIDARRPIGTEAPRRGEPQIARRASSRARCPRPCARRRRAARSAGCCRC